MVQMTMTASRGNHARVFPHSGYLGTTPVTVQGSLKLEVEEDNLLLDASSIQIRIRCYESEARSVAPGSKPRSVRTLYEVSETLWRVSDQPGGSKRLWAPVGAFQKEWRLVVPQDAHLHGALSTMSFRTWRVWWAVEGIVYHKPAGMFGNRLLKSFPLTLVQHHLPPSIPPTPRTHLTPLPNLLCSSSLERSVFGPTEDFSLQLSLESTMKAALRVKKVVVDVRREFSLLPSSTDSSPRTPPSDLLALATPECYPELYPPKVHRVPSQASDSEDTIKLLSQSHAKINTARQTDSYFTFETPPALPASKPRKDDISLLMMSKSEEFDLSKPRTLNFSGVLPKPNSLHHYSVGETCNTGTMHIKYYVAVKILCRSSKGSHTIDLPNQEITVVSVSTAERQSVAEKTGKVLLYQQAEERAFRTGRSTQRSPSVESTPRTSGAHQCSPDQIPPRRCSTAFDMLSMNDLAMGTSRRTSSSSAPLVPRRASNVYSDAEPGSSVKLDDYLSANTFLLEGRRDSRRPSVLSMSTGSTDKRQSNASLDSGIAEQSMPTINFSNFSLSTVHPARSFANVDSTPNRPEISPRNSSRDVGPKDLGKRRKSRHQLEAAQDMMDSDPNRSTTRSSSVSRTQSSSSWRRVFA